MYFYVGLVPTSGKILFGHNTVTGVLDEIEAQMSGVGKFENS